MAGGEVVRREAGMPETQALYNTEGIAMSDAHSLLI
jgi:hypothetical protein